MTLKKAEVTGVLNLSNVLQIDDANNTNITATKYLILAERTYKPSAIKIALNSRNTAVFIKRKHKPIKKEGMKSLDALYKKWKSLQPLNERKQYLLSQRFTVEYNYNSNHIEGNTLTYGQTELLLLFGKVSGEGDLKDFVDMKASQVGLKMMKEIYKNALDKATLPKESKENIKSLYDKVNKEDNVVSIEKKRNIKKPLAFVAAGLGYIFSAFISSSNACEASIIPQAVSLLNTLHIIIFSFCVIMSKTI